MTGLAPLVAQTPTEGASPPATTRAELLDGLRQKKAQEIAPPVRSGAEQFLYTLREQRYMEKFAAGWHGLHTKVGGLHTGSGFALGGEYRQERLWNGVLDFRASGQLSFKAYQKYETHLAMPRLMNQRVFLDFTLRQSNFPQEDFYGLGPRSRKRDRTNYRLEETAYLGTAGVRWKRWLRTGVNGGLLNINVGRGTDVRFPSTERVFTNAQAPGLDRQTDFYQVGAFAELDYRDEPGNPRSGGNYHAQWTLFGDREHSRHTFRRYEAELQQYLPFLNRRRVIAFRAKTSLTDTSPGQVVPFYMQQSIGGAEDLRGFREFRFRDKNLMVYNLEYRWEAFSGLDMAVFGDAGKVFPNRSDFNLSRLEGCYGMGFRFNQAKSVFIRIDVGKSREGLRYFFKFGHVF